MVRLHHQNNVFQCQLDERDSMAMDGQMGSDTMTNRSSKAAEVLGCSADAFEKSAC